jgi:hypothetical protein
LHALYLIIDRFQAPEAPTGERRDLLLTHLR